MNALMASKQRCVIAGAAGLLIVWCGSAVGFQSATAPPLDASRGHIAAPPGSETLTAALELNTVQLFEADDFAGANATLRVSDAAPQPGGLLELPNGLNDSLTSLRWNLAPGVIVAFYEDGSGKGEQLIIWGKGQSPDVSHWDFNDKATRWALYNVGASGASNAAGGVRAPNGSQPLATVVPDNTLQFFVDKDFRNDMTQVAPISENPGELHRIPSSQADSLTSLRWNLPEGVIVMLYQDAGGSKQQVAVWGQGQLADLDAWDFNDKASRWSWAYVGGPKPARQ